MHLLLLIFIQSNIQVIFENKDILKVKKIKPQQDFSFQGPPRPYRGHTL